MLKFAVQNRRRTNGDDVISATPVNGGILKCPGSKCGDVTLRHRSRSVSRVSFTVPEDDADDDDVIAGEPEDRSRSRCRTRRVAGRRSRSEESANQDPRNVPDLDSSGYNEKPVDVGDLEKRRPTRSCLRQAEWNDNKELSGERATPKAINGEVGRAEVGQQPEVPRAEVSLSQAGGKEDRSDVSQPPEVASPFSRLSVARKCKRLTSRTTSSREQATIAESCDLHVEECSKTEYDSIHQSPGGAVPDVVRCSEEVGFSVKEELPNDTTTPSGECSNDADIGSSDSKEVHSEENVSRDKPTLPFEADGCPDQFEFLRRLNGLVSHSVQNSVLHLSTSGSRLLSRDRSRDSLSSRSSGTSDLSLTSHLSGSGKSRSEDNVYLIDSPSQDSSSGIASDEHNTASATYDYISSGSETHCTKNKAYFESPQHSGYESDYVDLAEFSRTEVSRTKRQGERTDRGQTVIPGKGCPNKRSPWIGDRGSHELLNSEAHFLTKGSYVRERNNVWCEGDSHVIPKYDGGDVYRGSHLVDRNEAWTASRPRSGVVFTETNLDDSEAVHNSRAAPPGRIPGDRILTRDKQHVMRKPKIYVAHRQTSSNVPTSQHVSAPTPRTSVPAGTRHPHISGNTPSSVRPPPQPKPLPARNSHRFVMPTLCYFDIVPDDVIIRILRHLGSEELCCVSAVCLRWYKLAWDPSLWTTIRLNKPNINTDRALNVLTKKISYQTPNVCAIVDRIDVHGSVRLTDRGLYTISRMCPDLRMLDLAGCVQISNVALWEVVSRCVNLERLNVAGCPNITSICLTPEATIQAATYGKQVYIHHLDMSDCQKVDDSCIQLLASYCTNLTTVYLRRCALVSDLGIQYLANYCTQLAELSISDCVRVTDFGLRELAKLGQNLRYLSIAKCERITDSGLSYIATYCTRLRYINIRGCHVTREAIDLLVRNSTKLRSLDLGKCDVTDGVLDTVSRHGIHLRKLSLRACEYITDRGLMRLASRCTQLRQLNLQGCNLTVEAYRTIKKCCRLCVIEHTNPGFY